MIIYSKKKKGCQFINFPREIYIYPTPSGTKFEYSEYLIILLMLYYANVMLNRKQNKL